jgi:hypothetical protein
MPTSVDDLIASSQRAIAECERLANSGNNTRRLLRLDRRHSLSAAAALLAPDLSEATLKSVIAAIPSLYSRSLRAAFQHRLLFRFIATPSYIHALDSVRVSITAYLDTLKPDQVDALRRLPTHVFVYASAVIKNAQEFDAIAAKRRDAQAQLVDLRRTHDALVSARKRGARALPPGAISPLTPTASTGRSKAATRTGGHYSESDLDLWIYFATQVPTSSRTWLFEMLSDHSNETQSDSCGNQISGQSDNSGSQCAAETMGSFS